ncbi:MAG: hypothetical protein ACYCQJ_15380 [Nitrososphaerales archaeon]
MIGTELMMEYSSCTPVRQSNTTGCTRITTAKARVDIIGCTIRAGHNFSKLVPSVLLTAGA